jgi:hypothetical protein
MLDRYDQDLLLDYLEGELDADRRAQLDALLAEDEHLAALLSELARDRAALRALPQEQAPAGLVHDATHAMERRMLLDDSAEDTAPIPLSRGRAMAAEPTRSSNWGRVMGLTGLAASVALVAGVLVITFDDPLERTAEQLADGFATGEQTEQADEADALAARSDESFGIGSATESAQPLGAPGNPTPPDAVALEALESPLPADSAALARRAQDLVDVELGQPSVATLPNDATTSSLNEPSPPRPTAAISLIQPEQQLVLLTESPEVSKRQLVAFCIANGIPVVQPDRPEFPARNGVVLAEPNIASAGADNDSETTADAALLDEYALLINEAQLESLVSNLNTVVSIDADRAGTASVISNQAAKLKALPQVTSIEGTQNVPPHLDQQTNLDKLAANDTADPRVQQQAIQLRTPDLGSDFDNDRNAQNLFAQQRAIGAFTDVAADAAALREAPPTKSDTDSLNKRARELADDLAATDEAATPVEAAEEAQPADSAKAFELTPTDDLREADVASIDAVRGNWLSAHLPLADATPLVFPSRGEAERATQLVPIVIKRAPADEVNTLRLLQHNEADTPREVPHPTHEEDKDTSNAEDANADGSTRDGDSDSDVDADASGDAPSED